MTKDELFEHSEYLFNLAVSKTSNLEDAEDLVSETLIAGLVALEKGEKIQNPKAFLSGILNHKFTDGLRSKYSKPVIYYGILPDFAKANEDSALEQLIKKQDGEKIRQSLSLLTQNYREVLVKHFIHGKSVRQIALELELNENTVKSRLNSGRMQVKENYQMENFEKQSYEPEKLDVWVYGEIGSENGDNSFCGFDEKLIEQNILILAYKKPVTLQELSLALGISTAYLEPLVEKLIKGDFMKRVSDKVYTSFIIFEEEQIQAACDNDRKIGEENFREMWGDIESYFDEVRAQDFYKAMNQNQQESFLQFIALLILQESHREIQAEKFPQNNVMDVKHNGGWLGYAYGFHLERNAKEDWSANGYNLYQMNGPHTVFAGPYKNMENLFFRLYHVNTGYTMGAWYPLTEMEILKTLYALYKNEEQDIPTINSHFLDAEVLKKMESRRLLGKDSDGKLILNIPVLTHKDNLWMYDFYSKNIPAFTEKYRKALTQIYEKGVDIPKHLEKDVPEVMRCQLNGGYFPMVVIFQAVWNGLYHAGRDFQKNPLPAMVLYLGEEK